MAGDCCCGDTALLRVWQRRREGPWPPSHTRDPVPLGHDAGAHRAPSSPRPFLGQSEALTRSAQGREETTGADTGPATPDSTRRSSLVRGPGGAAAPGPPSASQGPWARRGGCWRHQLDSGLQPPSHPGLPSLPLPSAAPLSRVVLVSGWGGGWPAPAGSLCCGCLDPDPGSRLPRLAQLHPGCPGRAPEGTFHLPGFVVCSAVWCRAWGGRPSGPWGPRNLLAQGRQPALLRGSQCGLCPPCPGTCVS